MAMLVIFTENTTQSCYLPLATPERQIEIMPLAAVASIGERALDLAIVDCGDGVDAGLCLLQELKQMRADVPIIFVTEASSETVVMRAFKLGARDYFIKPFAPAEFTAAVVRILDFKLRQQWPGLSGSADKEVSSLFLPAEGVPERVLRAARYIEENLSAPLSLESIARQACLSKFHFCRLFKSHVGVSPMQYCVQRRIEYSRQLLASPNQTITMVAFKSGFNDVTEFIRQFKRNTGITPGAYRSSQPAPYPPK